MKFKLTVFIIFVLFVSTSAFAAESRAPQFAGSFYPAESAQLSGDIQKYLDEVPEQKVPDNLWGMIVPHAGIVFSGKTAAFSYKLLKEGSFDTVILIGPSHRNPFEGVSVWKEGAWQTPLGEVPINTELAQAIAGENEKFKFGPEMHQGEHSLEVQLPFLQMTLKKFSIVPVLMGDMSLDNAKLLANAIQKHTENKKVLIVISTDMSHYHQQDEASRKDRKTLGLIEGGNSGGLFLQLLQGRSELCGGAAVLVLLELAKLKGNTGFQFLKYADSSDASGDKNRVVGYSAFAVHQKGIDNLQDLNPAQQQELLKIAREALVNYVQYGKPPASKINDPVLFEDRGTFVTLRKNGELRGCIGNIAFEPLFLAVGSNAVKAATLDSRFPQVKREEIPEIKIEISVLSPFKKVNSAEEIQVGTHGVLIQNGERSGIFLPQVAAETGWDKETFMRELCTQKAGLSPDCWLDPQTEMYVFKAQIFEES